MTPESRVSVTENEIIIGELAIEDPDNIQYLTSREETPAETVRHELHVGVSTFRLSDTTEKAEFVRNGFAKMNDEVETDLDEFRDELK